MIHLDIISFRTAELPSADAYPFSLSLFDNLLEIIFKKPVTLFVGENGTGKSTVIEAIARACGIHIWEGNGKTRFKYNRYEKMLFRYIDVSWSN